MVSFSPRHSVYIHTGTLYSLKGCFDCSILHSDPNLTNDSGAARVVSSRQAEWVKVSSETLVVILMERWASVQQHLLCLFDSKGTLDFKFLQTHQLDLIHFFPFEFDFCRYFQDTYWSVFAY